MKEDIYGVIYKITNTENNKVYIGQTTRKNGFKGRYNSIGTGIERVYNSSLKGGNISNKHLIRAIEKYGFYSFDVDEEFDVAYSKDELNNKEIYWINNYNSTDKKYGYNKKTGGDSGIWTIETRKEMLLKIGKPVICKDTNEVFISAKDVELKYSIPSSVVRSSANGKNTNCGMKFKWMKIGMSCPLIDLNSGKRFKSPAEIEKIYGKQIGERKLYKKEPFTKNTLDYFGLKLQSHYNYIIENYEELMKDYIF